MHRYPDSELDSVVNRTAMIMSLLAMIIPYGASIVPILRYRRVWSSLLRYLALRSNEDVLH